MEEEDKVGGDLVSSSTSIPDSSIIGVKPVIEPIPYDIVELETRMRSKNLNKSSWRRCCICDAMPTQIASYPIQGAVRIERYCDSCAEKQFSRSSKGEKL